MKYDTSLFLEIIESIQGVTFLRADELDGTHIRFYQGVNGRLVKIDSTDEDMYDSTAKGHLELLGLSHLIPTLFPEPKPNTPS